MSVAFVTAVTVCAGIASPFEPNMMKPDHVIYKLVQDLVHRHDTRHGNFTLMGPRSWKVHGTAVFAPLALHPSKDEVLDDRLPPAPAGTDGPLVAWLGWRKPKRHEGSRVLYIAQEHRLVTHLAKGLDLGIVKFKVLFHDPKGLWEVDHEWTLKMYFLDLHHTQ